MSQLATNTPPIFEDNGINTLPVAASTTIYYGSAVGDNGSGYARQLVAADPFRGFCLGLVANVSPGGFGAPSTAGSAGALSVAVKYSGLILATFSSVAITNVGAPVYMSDGATFSLTASGNSLVGHVHRYVSATQAVVAFNASQAPVAVTQITDSTGGTASTTVAAITAGASYAQADMVAVKNGLASIIAQLNAV